MNVWALHMVESNKNITTLIFCFISTNCFNYTPPAATRTCLLYTSGVKSLLRSEIIRNDEKYTDRGYCPIYAREPLSHVYEAYHALGGNSTATDLYKKTMALPSDPPSDPSEE